MQFISIKGPYVSPAGDRLKLKKLLKIKKFCADRKHRVELYFDSPSQFFCRSKKQVIPQGVLLANLGGGVPHGSPNPDPIQIKKCHFSHPFSDLASYLPAFLGTGLPRGNAQKKCASKIHTHSRTWTLKDYVIITQIRTATRKIS